MAEQSDLQTQFYADLQQCKEKMGKIVSSECHYANAVLEEVFRFRHISESIMRQVESDMYIEGQFVPAGTLVQANFAAVHFNPDYFDEPGKFNPERFIDCKTGRFKKSQYVIPFSIGLRECPGKRIARLEVFDFASKLIDAFQITNNLHDVTPDEHYGLFMPKELKLCFTSRIR